jgi:hypothetical protein
MVPLRPVLSLLVGAALLGTACGPNTPERRPTPEPSSAVQRELGYRDIVQIGEEYALGQGYELASVVAAEEVRPNYWRVRFGLAPKGSGKLLQIEFDEERRRVVEATEIGGAAGRPPTP